MTYQSLNLIGKRVREARYAKKPKITQLNLASKLQLEGLEIEQTQISKIENSSRSVTDIELSILAKILNVSSSWLIGETDDPQRFS